MTRKGEKGVNYNTLKNLEKAWKRTQGQREADLVTIAQLYIRGYSQAQILDEITRDKPYTLSRAMIYKDIKEIQRRWQESYMLDFNQYKARELAHIDELERAYWAEYERSRLDKEEVYSEKIKDTNAGPDGKPVSQWAREKVKAVKKKVGGQAVFLDGVLKCINKRCEILGLNAPQTVNVNWREQATAAGMDPDRVLEDLERQFLQAAAAGQSKTTGD